MAFMRKQPKKWGTRRELNLGHISRTYASGVPLNRSAPLKPSPLRVNQKKQFLRMYTLNYPAGFQLKSSAFCTFFAYGFLTSSKSKNQRKAFPLLSCADTPFYLSLKPIYLKLVPQAGTPGP
jgi:hypothetical protein